MTTPTRLQRRRTPGYNMQAESLALNGLECVSVTRPGKWGNPFLIEAHKGDVEREWAGYGVYNPATIQSECAKRAVAQYRRWLKNEILYNALSLESLRGKNLACFCKIGEPCHADVLLEFANR